MRKSDLDQLIGDIKTALAQDLRSTFGIIGHTPLAYDIISFFRAVGAENRLLGVYSDQAEQLGADAWHRAVGQLGADSPDVVIIASDSDKEHLLELASPHLRPEVRVLLAGYGHFAFRDLVFDEVVRTALVPSLANGYPNTLVHLYQCLHNAARLELSGVVVEFGMFKGGTTVLLSRFIERLGRSWHVIGSDTFAGFPPKRSVLDMYDHPDCVFSDEELVRRHVGGRNIEVVTGDIVTTVKRLADEDVILAFIDTDNFTSASAVLDVIQDRIVAGGAILFDHFTGRNRFRYTLGERLAAKRLLEDKRYFNLHDTGVFLRQR
jgi:O-methyltransferase